MLFEVSNEAEEERKPFCFRGPCPKTLRPDHNSRFITQPRPFSQLIETARFTAVARACARGVLRREKFLRLAWM